MMKKICFLFVLFLSFSCQAQQQAPQGFEFDLTLGKHEPDAPMQAGKYQMQLAGVQVASGAYDGLHLHFTGSDGDKKIIFEVELPSNDKLWIHESWKEKKLNFDFGSSQLPVKISPKDYETLKDAFDQPLKPMVGLQKTLSVTKTGMSTSTNVAYITFLDFQLTVEKFTMLDGKLFFDGTITGKTDERFYSSTKGEYTISGKIHIDGIVPGIVDIE